MFRRFVGVALLSPALLATPAGAHFQSIYTPNYVIDLPGEIPLKLIFWHPFFVGPNVDMPLPERVYAISRFQEIDLMPSLRETVFHGPQNPAVAYDVTLPVRQVGDYVVVVEGGLFYDETAGGYIQQFTKAVLNRGGFPTDWNIPVGLPTEIIPLTKPYNVMAGSTFTGMLTRDGEPLPFWEVEIVYLSAEPDMETNTVGEETISPPPGGYLVVTTDPNGIFTVGIPRAGFWGFGALGSGPETSVQAVMPTPVDQAPAAALPFGLEAPAAIETSTPLSQDAILWIEAHDLE